jgi:Domain of unknown function (DUF6754)
VNRAQFKSATVRRPIAVRSVILLSLIFLFLASLLSLPAQAQSDSATPGPLPAPAVLVAEDKPLDSGHTVILNWTASPDDGAGLDIVTGYYLYRADSEDGEFLLIQDRLLDQGDGRFQDRNDKSIGSRKVNAGQTYYYRIDAITADGQESQSAVVSIAPEATLFNPEKWKALIAVAVYIAILLSMIWLARTGREMFIRRLAGIDALDEAVGRATEMGKPVLYLCGMLDLGEVSTIAAVNILSGVAEKVGAYQSKLLMPCRDPMVMSVSQEVVKESYMKIGRPEAFRSEDIFYTTYDQFPYVASVDGIMLREKPATNIYMGYYFAESLILAETGAMSGAIQIAGTDAITQLPFFVVACDYTIIGEELYAASAYISRDPKLVGSIKGQDYMKLALAICLIIGIISATVLHFSPDVAICQAFLNFF